MLNPQEKTTLEIQPSINSRNKKEIKGRKQTDIRIQK